MIDKAGQNKKWIQMREKAKGDKEMKKEERRTGKTWVKIQKESGGTRGEKLEIKMVSRML